MSDVLLSLIPEDPGYVPIAEAQQHALNALRALLPRSSDVEAKVFDQVTFIDQGGNFERVQCPACDADVTTQWPAWMDKAFAAQFSELALTMPCCGLATDLNALRYDWPAGFARFALRARNPGIGGWLSAGDLSILENVAGCRLRQVYARY
jgi:hypothetical protein